MEHQIGHKTPGSQSKNALFRRLVNFSVRAPTFRCKRWDEIKELSDSIAMGATNKQTTGEFSCQTSITERYYVKNVFVEYVRKGELIQKLCGLGVHGIPQLRGKWYTTTIRQISPQKNTEYEYWISNKCYVIVIVSSASCDSLSTCSQMFSFGIPGHFCGSSVSRRRGELADQDVIVQWNRVISVVNIS